MQNTDNTARSERALDWRPWRDWVATDGNTLFCSAASFEWFLRRHKVKLIEAGVLIVRQGRGGAIVGPGIDGVVLDILRQEGLAMSNAGEAQA